MSNAGEKASPLALALREVKTRVADREDVVVELREATRARLELLAAELQPIFDEVPDEIDIFDFAIASGLQPRLWIDGVAHVALARDRRTFRFQRDTRGGRVILAESAATKPIVESVTRYIAERIVERERALDGVTGVLPRMAEEEPVAEQAAPQPSPLHAIASGFGLLVSGALAGLALFALFFWDQLARWLGWQ